jgi:hypothetical protein
MSRVRVEGAEHPGLRWGPFTLRIPIYHTRIEWPELLQGLSVAFPTALALVPLCTEVFGLTFEQALALVMVHATLLCTSPILFGEPFAPGWITPALPLVLATLVPSGTAAFSTPADGFRQMTAITLMFTAILFFMSFTGLAHSLIRWVPDVLKGGIIMGAAMAAMYRVFIDDPTLFQAQPVSTLVAVSISLVLTFSALVQRYRSRFAWLRILSGLGLLPGFAAAALVGPFIPTFSNSGETTGREIVYQVESGLLIPDFLGMWEKTSPFAIGWPSLDMYVAGLPLALMGYVILYGDVITGLEILKGGMASRPDEKISIDLNRTHKSLGIRNGLMALLAPFFPTQGILWTGVHVIVVQRWGQGRQGIDSLFSAIASYYVFGIPFVLCLSAALVTACRPLMSITLSLTLVLTGFACSYVGLGMQKTPIQRGVVVLIGFSIAMIPNPWIGMAVAAIATLGLCGWQTGQEGSE